MSFIDGCSTKSAQRDRIEFLVPFNSKSAFRRLARVFRYGGQMVLWRGLALGAAAAGAVWAARCLGPESMGISGMILSTATQLAILIDLNQNTALVRREVPRHDAQELVAAVFTSVLLFARWL
jgi:hypothetical protein